MRLGVALTNRIAKNDSFNEYFCSAEVHWILWFMAIKSIYGQIMQLITFLFPVSVGEFSRKILCLRIREHPLNLRVRIHTLSLDSLPTVALKAMPGLLFLLLNHSYKQFIFCCIFPRLLKVARVTQIFKSGILEDVMSFRTISSFVD